MKLKLIFLSVFLFTLGQTVVFSNFTVGDLYQYGTACNIEGGVPAQKLGSKGHWINLVAILDRPFVDGKTLEETTKAADDAGLILKEYVVQDYNEAKVHQAIGSILAYYIEHGREKLGKPDEQEQKIIFHIHRNSSGEAQHKLYKELLRKLYDVEIENVNSSVPGFYGRWYIPEHKTTLEFRTGFLESKGHFGNYGDADYLFSFSIAAGLDPKHKPGTMLIPTKFIPYYESEYRLDTTKKYEVRNVLAKDLVDICGNKNTARQRQIADLINENEVSIDYKKDGEDNKKLRFLSPRHNPQHKTTILTEKDFVNNVTNLQIQGLWNPANLEVEKSKPVTIQ